MIDPKVMQTVAEALNVQDSGLAVFDAEDRLVFCNEAHGDLFPLMAPLMMPGTTFDDILRGAVAVGQFDLDKHDRDPGYGSGWIGGIADKPIDLKTDTGRWLRGQEKRLPEGGWLIAWSDITQQKRRESALAKLLAGDPERNDFFAVAAEALASGLGCRWGGVTRYDERKETASVVAFFDSGKPQANFTYNLAGTPCQDVFENNGYCYVPRDVASHYPEDEILAEIEAETYYGSLVSAGDGEPLGNVMAMHDGPDPADGGGEEFVRMIARWVGIEFDRQKAREELEHRTSLFMDFAEASSDWLWETDADLRFTRFTSAPGFVEDRNLKVRIGRTPFEDFAPFGDQEGWQQVQADMEKRVPLRGFIFPIVDSRGRQFVYSVSGKPLYDAAGGFTGYRGTAFDITERWKAEDELARQSSAMEGVFENMDEGVSLFGSDLKMRAWNTRYHELLDFPAEMCFRGATFESFIRYNAERGEYGAGDVDELVAERVELARKFVAHRFERVREDGKVIEVRGTPIPGGGFVSIYADVTERYNAERSLRESEERYALAVAGAQDGLWDWSPKSDTGYISPRVAEFMGFGPDDPQPTLADWRASMVEEDVPAYRSALTAHLKGETSNYEVEYRIRNRKGEHVWILARGIGLRDEAGQVYRMSGSLTDITERKRTDELALAARKQAEAASRTKSEFLANISHELRTPLNAVIGFSEIMTGQMFGPLGHPSYMEYARDIYESGSHLLEVINDILDVAKAEAGKFELDVEEVSLEKIATAAIRLIAPRAGTAKVEVSLEAAEELPELLIDQRRMKQVFINLLSNAVKFTPEGGSVAVKLRLAGDGAPEIVIADSGIGMAPGDIETALQPFSQLDSRLSRRFEGTGLGLPLARTLIEVHGGTLLIESSPGSGTTVTVRLPASTIVAEDKTAGEDGPLRRVNAAE